MTRTAIPAEAFEHGDYRRYWRGCRCPKCTTAASNRSARNDLMRQRGLGDICSPQQAAARIAALQNAGVTNAAIQQAAQISECTFYRAVQGRAIRRESLAKIMAIPVPVRPATGTKALRPSIGTQRRLQALVVAGWPAVALADRLGFDRKFGHRLLYRGDQRVALQTELLVRRLFAQLILLEPEANGVHPTSAKRARLLGVRRGWHPIGAWDDIDDPNELPQYGESAPRPDAIVEDTAELVAQGLSRDAIAERLGVTWDAVQKAHSRLSRPLPELAA